MNKTIWNTTKVISVLFNSIATWNVFYGLFYDNTGSQFWSGSAAICAILLIDLQFISLINLLEAPLERGEIYSQRKPYAQALLILYACIVLIGLADEGLFAIAPRVGLGIMALVTLSRYRMISKAEFDANWQAEFDKRKQRDQKQDDLALQKKQRKLKYHAKGWALKKLEPELRQKYILDYRREFELTMQAMIRKTREEEQAELHAERQSAADLKQVKARKLHVIPAKTARREVHAGLPEPSLDDLVKQDSGDLVLPDGVHADGAAYGWECPHCEESDAGLKTAKGAQIARTRHMNSAHQMVPHHNGQHK